MPRKKEPKLVITFHTTADAMSFEKHCRDQRLPGRLIPVPRAISAGCGMAWCVSTGDREQITDFIQKEDPAYQAMQECMV